MARPRVIELDVGTSKPLRTSATQVALLSLVARSLCEAGRSPSLSEICRAMGWRQKRAAQDALLVLARQGLIDFDRVQDDSHVWRTNMVVTPLGGAALVAATSERVEAPSPRACPTCGRALPVGP